MYRAQIVQRTALRKRHHYGQWLGSWFLAALAGYGYKPMHTIIWYLWYLWYLWYRIVILGSAGGYLLASHGLSLFGLTTSAWSKSPGAAVARSVRTRQIENGVHDVHRSAL